MSNVLIINSSSGKKNTYRVLSQIEQLLMDCGVNTEIVNLFDFQIDSCIGCQKCVTVGSCYLNDDMSTLMEKIRNADGLVLSSPVYIENVSGKLKTFADRTCMWYHTPEIAGKPILFATTTSATGLKNIKKSFEAIAISWGAQITNFISRMSRDLNKSIDKKELSQFLMLLKEGKQAYRPSFYEINIFQVQKVLALKSNGSDGKYWRSHGLSDKIYYYECRTNFFKRVFSKAVFILLTKVID